MICTDIEATPADAPILSERRNIFDNDEFDVMAVDKLPASRVHRGKKVLNPIRHTCAHKCAQDQIVDTRKLLSQRAFERDPQYLIRSMYLYDNYDDEYDDSYDDVVNYNIILESADVEEVSSKKKDVQDAQEESETDSSDDQAGPAPAPTQDAARGRGAPISAQQRARKERQKGSRYHLYTN